MWKFTCHVHRFTLCVVLVWSLFLTSAILGAQEVTPSQAQRWHEGDFQGREVEHAAYQQQTWAIPGLEKVFTQESDRWKRFVAAAALIELGSPDSQYWDFMETVARQAMAYRGPNPIKRSESGRMLDGSLSDEFVAWCADRGVDPLDYYGRVIMHDEARVFHKLMFWQDRRVIPLLREALRSNNPYVVSAAGMGLGNRGDIQGLDLIVARYRDLGLLRDDDAGNLSRVLSRFKQSEVRKIPEEWQQEHKEALEQAERIRPDAYRLQ